MHGGGADRGGLRRAPACSRVEDARLPWGARVNLLADGSTHQRIDFAGHYEHRPGLAERVQRVHELDGIKCVEGLAGVAERQGDGLWTDVELVWVLAVPDRIDRFDPQVGEHARKIVGEALREIETVLDAEQQHVDARHAGRGARWRRRDLARL